jgi:hypothetical protein
VLSQVAAKSRIGVSVGRGGVSRRY